VTSSVTSIREVKTINIWCFCYKWKNKNQWISDDLTWRQNNKDLSSSLCRKTKNNHVQ